MSDSVTFVVAFLAVCITASANYTINEIFDGQGDSKHPDKCSRVVVGKEISVFGAGTMYVLLSGLAGVSAWFTNAYFFWGCVVFWAMGVIYNVPPLRTKELPYIDAISEAVNNPIRLVLGWWMVDTRYLPPISALGAYWTLGAYMMTLKRFAEYRRIADAAVAAQYRRSFATTDDNRLLVAAVFYANACCLLFGVFIAKYRLELVLSFPAIAILLAYYLSLSHRENSIVQYPEVLYRDRLLLTLVLGASIVALWSLWVDIPQLHALLRMYEIPSGIRGALHTSRGTFL